MNKHTPGPWDYSWNGHYFDIGILRDCSVVPIFPQTCMGVCAAQEANARLIAAAPELLEALTRLRDAYVGKYNDSIKAICWEQAQDAIAKAEGAQ